MALSNGYSSLARPDFRLTVCRFHIHSIENGRWKLLWKLDRDQRSDQKLWPFRTGTPVSSDETSSSPSGDSTSTPRKTTSGNSSKKLRDIQRSDQKLWPFRTGTMVSSDETSSSPSSDSTSTPRKTAFGNSYKIWGWSNVRITNYSSFEPLLWSGLTSPTRHWVAIQHLLQGKRSPKTLVKILSWSTVGSKVKALSNCYSGLARPDLRLMEYRFHIHSIEKGL